MRDRRFLLLYVVVALTGCGGGDSPRAATKAAEGEMGGGNGGNGVPIP